MDSVHDFAIDLDYAAGPASPSAPPPPVRRCRPAVASRVTWPRPPSAHARRPVRPRAVRRRACARVAPRRAGPSGGPGAVPPARRAARNHYHFVVVVVCWLLCLFQASCFRLLLFVVLRVGVVLLLVCHADFLFLPLFLSSVVSCACGFVCVRCCRLLLFVC